MTHIPAGKILLTASAAWAGAGAFVFDWNATHIYNPDWPPHAKFHNAQTMSLGVGLALTTAAVIWSRGTGWTDTRLRVAATTASLYWATQLSSLLFPGVALMDPPAPSSRKGPQAVIATAGLTINLLGYLLERRALRLPSGR